MKFIIKKTLTLFGKLSFLIDKYWTVKFYIAGINPGTTVAVVCPQTRKSYVTGHANEKGEFLSKIPRRLVGKEVYAPVRQAGLKYDHDFYLIVQPWGLFRAVRQTVDCSDEADAPATQAELDDLYKKGEVDIQYAVRQVINKTVFFIILSVLGVLGFLIKFMGVPYFYAIIITIVLVAIKTIFTTHAMGLKRKSLHSK